MSEFTLHLLRHGAPVTAGRMMGRTDIEPTNEGIAACLDRALDLDIRKLISSDLKRARHAGEAIAAAISVPLDIEPRWRELDFGNWDGKAASDLDPASLGRFWSDPDTNPPPGGERWSSLIARIAGAVSALEPVPTLVVTHGGAIRAALHVLCGFEQPQLWAFDVPYAALLSLRVWRGEHPTAQIVGLRP